MSADFPPLADAGRFPYSPIHRRAPFSWPEGKGLAVYIGFNVEHFAFGSGLGARLGAAFGEPDVLNYSWREYGNRVGAWRCLEMFDALRLPTGLIANTALFDHCPELVDAFLARGDELIAHGHSNAEHQGQWSEDQERALLIHCRERIIGRYGKAPAGWLSPWIAESLHTPDLLAECGYRYTLNWCHDDQPLRMATRSDAGLWSIPYPQEANDIPMIAGRNLDGPGFADLLVDNLEEMREQAQRQSLVMGIALHPYLVGQPHRLRPLRRALTQLAALRDRGEIWLTTPGAIHDHMETLFPAPADPARLGAGHPPVSE